MGLDMKTRKAITEQIRKRYRKSSKKEKAKILDEFVNTTGYNRKYAVRILNQKTELTVYEKGRAVKIKRANRPRNRLGKKLYDEQTVKSLRLIWAFFWYKCGKILAPFIRKNIGFLSSFPQFQINDEVREKLVRISPASIDRALKKDRDALNIRGKSCAKPSHSLRSLIPIRTFYTPEERLVPGFMQIDTVHHCGQDTSGEYCISLTATDVFSSWTEEYAQLNKAYKWTFEGLKQAKENVPFKILELHPDNGSEFMNESAWRWTQAEGIAYTHSRSRHKNDNCFVEQKNNSIVRNYIGYYRLAGEVQRDLLNEVYRHLVPLLNFFIPVKKLVSKEKTGSKEIKRYDSPKTPFERLVESDRLTAEEKQSLMERYELYNPVTLQQNVNRAINALRDEANRSLAVQALEIN